MAPDLGMNVIFIFVMFAVLYFMMIRPQMKRQKELKAMLSALAKGDEVMVSGLVGKITEIDDNYVRLEIAKGVVVQVQRAAVSILLPKGTFKS
ncbi:preprotein translocase subunit YajC [Ferrovum sp. JA12]|uniref:preprotein translocase subunit YajC n=2 Tax=Ferrovum sp. JA12 TaxID=1356299 RepID=UPI0007128B78|nr:preprotein translocase subunit YajC [Ferrovum sp. JA12]KRH78078.1 preprotein translocase subunit YajC [Ferrovum sp. JA12]HQT81191.1 preprotein translocase subunit YajC [Ferrovaceae bacterium]HQU05644.1 preprotein translocase subunit YajC [Ferrovaceae bacterium]